VLESTVKPLLTDAQWTHIAPLLPKPRRKPLGGRPRVDDRACFEGILWILRTGARWRDLPPTYPSGVTCWRRLGEWERADVWLRLWRGFLKTLNTRKQLDWSEAFLDGTFAPAKKGALASAQHAKARGQSLWYWSTARVFLSECTFRLPLPPKSTSPRSRLRRSRSRRGGAAGRA